MNQRSRANGLVVVLGCLAVLSGCSPEIWRILDELHGRGRDAAHDVGNADAGETAPPPDAGVAACVLGPPLIEGDPIGRCVPLAPFGWVGPGTLTSAATATAVPACPPSELEFARGSVLGTQAATCGACSCGPPQGLACGDPSFGDFYWDAECTFRCSALCAFCGSNCLNNQLACAFRGNQAGFMEVKPGSLTSGRCEPSPPPAPPPVTYRQFARACVLHSQITGFGDCRLGGKCVGRTARVCLFRKGSDLPCPRGPYTERQIFHATVSDQRQCTSCTCGSPIGITCPVRATRHAPDLSGQACTAPAHEVIEPAGHCLPLGASTPAMLAVASGSPAGDGRCEAAGSATGAIVASDPFTACCLPD